MVKLRRHGGTAVRRGLVVGRSAFSSGGPESCFQAANHSAPPDSGVCALSPAHAMAIALSFLSPARILEFVTVPLTGTIRLFGGGRFVRRRGNVHDGGRRRGVTSPTRVEDTSTARGVSWPGFGDPMLPPPPTLVAFSVAFAGLNACLLRAVFPACVDTGATKG